MKTLPEKQEAWSLIIDETGFFKKSALQASRGNILEHQEGWKNSKIGVFLALSDSNGHTLIGSELYLPKEWCESKEPGKAAGVPS